MKLTVQGREAYAYTGGVAFDPTLPCVVFLHGALHDHSGWTLLARWFAHHGHSVLALDEPGHGRSAGPPLPDVAALADWTLAVLDAAGVQQGAALVGHSLGSLIALEAAARAPARINRLVMIATAYPMKVSDALLTTARERPLAAIDMVNQFSISSWAAKPSFPGPGMWLHGSNRALMRRVLSGPNAGAAPVNLFHHDFSVCDGYSGGLQAAARVACPVTLVLGSRDQMTALRASRDLQAALAARPAPAPAAPQVVVLEAGHSLMAEAPDAVLAAVRQALR
jgi:pimeloyl-ACP methyl ester carboxylesterase